MKTNLITIVLLFPLLCLACSNNDSDPASQPETDTSLDCKSVQETGYYETFYKPYAGYVGDPMPYYRAEDKSFYLFFLYENKNKHPITYTRTEDYAHFEKFGEALPSGYTGTQDEWIGTGSFIRKDNTYYCFYTGHNANLSPREKVMLATSPDLQSWTRQPAFRIEAPEGYDKDNFRDPCVYFDNTRQAYVMLVTSRKDNQAIIARYLSSDLLSWSLIDPLTDFESDSEILECPDIFQMGDKWYLVFSRINRDVHRKTFYRVADSPDGPWRICRDAQGHHETFDGLYLYAGKTASDGNKRYLSGWCSTGQTVNSNNELDWGGALITHRLAQQASGKLYPVIPDALDNKFSQAIEYKSIRQTGTITNNDGKLTIDEGSVVFNRNPQAIKVTLEIDATQTTGTFGIGLGACDEQEDMYAITFDLTENNPYGTAGLFMYNNETELNFTPLIVPENKRFDITLIIEKSVCVLYVNDNIAFTNRIYKMANNPWCLFSNDGAIVVSGMNIYKEKT